MSAAFRIETKSEPGLGVFLLIGVIDERADLSPIKSTKGSAVVLDFGGVPRLTSYGVKKWMKALLSLKGRSITYRNCSTCVVEQLNVLADLRRGIKIESFAIPMSCSCNDAETHVTVTADEAAAPGFLQSLKTRFTCSLCDRKLEFADDEDLYFNFLAAT